MEKELIQKVKEKKEFSGLPDSLIEKALVICKEDVKETRALLRKYFGVFLTNKIMKLKSKDFGAEVLKLHKSSQKRDYSVLYKKIFEKSKFDCVIDLGCGVNGFSFEFLKSYCDFYIGLESVKQIVDLQNSYFRDKGIGNFQILWKDLFDLNKLGLVLKQCDGKKIIFMFQVIDALEGFERDFSKNLLLQIKERMAKEDEIVLSFSLKSLSGRNKFEVSRNWILKFLEQEFDIVECFALFDEKFVRVRKK